MFDSCTEELMDERRTCRNSMCMYVHHVISHPVLCTCTYVHFPWHTCTYTCVHVDVLRKRRTGKYIIRTYVFACVCTCITVSLSIVKDKVLRWHNIYVPTYICVGM